MSFLGRPAGFRSVAWLGRWVWYLQGWQAAKLPVLPLKIPAPSRSRAYQQLHEPASTLIRLVQDWLGAAASFKPILQRWRHRFVVVARKALRPDYLGQ